MIDLRSSAPASLLWVSPLLVFGLACSQKPTQLRIDGEVPKEIFGALPLRLPGVTVLDAKGQPLSEQPEVKIDCSPADVALIQDRQLIPLKNGKADLRFSLPGTNISATQKLTINLVDRIELECPEDGCDLSTGQKTSMRAKFMQGDAALAGVTGSWQSSSPDVVEVDDRGTIVAKTAGESTVSVKVGAFEAKQILKVLGTAPPDKLTLGCKKENVNVFDAAGGCLVRKGVPMEMELVAHAAGAPVRVPKLEWTIKDPAVAEVEQGRLAMVIGSGLGSTVISAKYGSAEASLEIEVIPPPCSESNSESFRQQMGKEDSIALLCSMEDAEACFNHYVDKKKPVQAHVDKALERCCCEIREKAPEAEAAAPDGE